MDDMKQRYMDFLSGMGEDKLRDLCADLLVAVDSCAQAQNWPPISIHNLPSQCARIYAGRVVLLVKHRREMLQAVSTLTGESTKVLGPSGFTSLDRF